MEANRKRWKQPRKRNNIDMNFCRLFSKESFLNISSNLKLKLKKTSEDLLNFWSFVGLHN